MYFYFILVNAYLIAKHNCSLLLYHNAMFILANIVTTMYYFKLGKKKKNF